MGRDKALLASAPGAGTWLERALDVLEPFVGRGLVACGATPRYGELLAARPRWSTVLDARPAGGPLAGLEAGLAAATGGWVLALAVDMPGVGPPAIEALLEGARADDDVVLFEEPEGFQPLFGLYHARCLSAVRAALDAGRRRMISFWTGPGADGALRVRRLSRAGLAAGADEGRGGVGDALRNVNTPEEWAAERARLERA